MRRWPWKLENAAERKFYKASKWKDVPCSQVRTLNTAKRAIFSNWSTDSGRSLLKSGLFWWKWHEDPRLHVERQGTQDPKQPWGKLFWLESTHLSSRLNYELEWTRPHNRGARLGMQASEHGWRLRIVDEATTHGQLSVNKEARAIQCANESLFNSPTVLRRHVHRNESGSLPQIIYTKTNSDWLRDLT